MNLGRRLRGVRDHLNISQGDFATALGIKQGSLSDIERGKNSLSGQISEILVLNYDVNLNWLYTGDGDMFIFGSPNSDLAGKNLFVPISAQAGYTPSNDATVNNSHLTQVIIPGIDGEARTFQISGNSMEPYLFDGDLVSGPRVPDFRDIRHASIYTFVTNYGLYIKHAIISSKGILLSSSNTDNKPFILPYEDIIEVWSADVKITSRLSDGYDNYFELKKIKNFLSSKFGDFDELV